MSSTSSPSSFENDPIQDANHFACDGVVNTFVGQERRLFIVHKSVLATASDYFRACLNSDFKEGMNDEYEFPDDTPAAFSYIATYLYHKQIPELSEPGFEEQECNLIRAWVIADKHGMTRCANALMDALRKNYRNNFIGAHGLQVLEDQNVLPSSTIYQYIIEQTAYDVLHHPCTIFNTWEEADSGTSEHAANHLRECRQVIIDLLQLIMRHSAMLDFDEQDVRDPSKIPGCVYHDHVLGESCEKSD